LVLRGLGRGAKDAWSLTALFGIVFLGAAIALVFIRDSRQPWKRFSPEPKTIVPTLTGKPERCLTCHSGIEEISPAHPISAFGCVICHGGSALALSKTRAHRGLLGNRNPASLRVQEKTCGVEGCHTRQDNPKRSPSISVPLTLMATKASEVSKTAFALGWQSDELARFGVVETKNPFGLAPEPLKKRALLSNSLAPFKAWDHPLKARFVKNCLEFCHLHSGYDQNNPKARHLSGCSACHVPFRPDGRYLGKDRTINKGETGHAPYHRMTTAIPYTACNACHNQGVHSLRLKFFYRTDIPRASITDPKADRFKAYYIPQAQFARCEVELECIDCHTRTEVMGDGHLTGNKASLQRVRCKTCHGTRSSPPDLQTLETGANEAFWMVRSYRKGFPALRLGDRVVVADGNDPLPHVREENGRIVLHSKVYEKSWEVPLVFRSGCTQTPEKQRSQDCYLCHDASRSFR
jgi:ssDNA-binding Zn-finger/Zn-ribbon topoisomerase 1